MMRCRGCRRWASRPVCYLCLVDAAAEASGESVEQIKLDDRRFRLERTGGSNAARAAVGLPVGGSS